jgi:uncharacterized caspase-like protein
MVNYWLVSIGINQYQSFPSLSYAQRDAELLHEFLIQAAGFAPQCCKLLTDQVTLSTTDPRFPTADHIQQQMARLQQTVKPGDVVLCLFSGHGVQFQDKDYLLPIEAEPDQIAATGIAVEALLRDLKAIPTPNIVMLLDANRSQLGLERHRFGVQTGFGAQTAQLAHEYGIAILLSCQPDQFSHEPLTLRQGIFTTGLIAALESGCLTLEQLVDGLSAQLPNLSEEFWRPRQDLLAVVPPHLRYQMLLPDQVGRKSARPTGLRLTHSTAPEASRTEQSALFAQQFAFLVQTSAQLKQKVTNWLTPRTQAIAPNIAPNIAPSSVAALSPSNPTVALDSDSRHPSTALDDPASFSDELFWRRLLVQGGLIAGILLFGVILRNSGALIGTSSSTTSSTTSVEQPASSQASSEPAPPSSSVSPSSVSGTPISSPVVAVDPVLLMQSAQTAFQAQQYEDANRQLVQIPAEQRTAEQAQLLEQINRELLNKAKTMLIRIRQPMTQNQVSDLVEAIKIARLIKPDQPLYQEAQQNIDRWSRVILDMAQGRAARSNGESAVDAANNYGAAVSAARLVPTDQAAYTQAQQAITLWSQKILDLANARAANGDLDLAIQIGELVPPNTPAYSAAQEAMADWRNQPAPAQSASNQSAQSAPTAIETAPEN